MLYLIILKKFCDSADREYMKKKSFIFFLILFLYPLLFLSAKNSHQNFRGNTDFSNNAIPVYAEQILAYMSLKEKVGQLIMVGIKGTTINPQTQKLISELKLGGIILYSHNVTDPYQVKTFTASIQNVAKENRVIPLFIAVDQEGGSVVRIRKHTQALPAAMVIGATRSSQFSFLSGKFTAQMLSGMGINMNLAPVLDINTTEHNAVIGVRSYGSDPSLVSQLGMWYIEGLQSRGVIATAKHFPGHGDTPIDSHYALPVLNKKLEDLEDFHFIPFRKAIDNGLDAIMTAHISIPSLDPSGLPTTFSYNLLTNVVRDKLHFGGIIITDDLEMKSIRDQYGIGQAALKAILAGADVVMVGWSDDKKHEVFNTLYEAVQSGKLTEERIDESLKRIIALKLKRGFLNEKPEESDLFKILSNEEHKKLANQIANHAVTVVSNKKGVLPLEENDGRKVLVISSLSKLFKDIQFFHPRSNYYHMPYRPTVKQREKMISDLLKLKNNYHVFIFGLTHSSQINAVNVFAQKTKKNVVAISFGSPYWAKKLNHVSSFICSYDSQPELIYATAQMLAGVIPAQGKLPISLEEPKVVLAPPFELLKTSQR